jgi:hypothetical protein
MSLTIGFLQIPNRDLVCTPSAIEFTFSAIAIQYLQVPHGISKNSKLKSTIKKGYYLFPDLQLRHTLKHPDR